ncbi:DUF4291 family protein [Actibacterium sp. 188UL27-1]|uniref:DUF4291 family protein n=1 Tax=Actibacterium sp. 188UL27-1 TaxID=2786961 RepID=UPI0019581B95|nr:DUF4291 family protein [Actibacterium sp. 188UL27-1]MBM7066809.1 DUF4291 family protein [Actibacterium sp. 188UL27-1]
MPPCRLLRHLCPPDGAAWKAGLSAAPVRMQWDPERGIHAQRLDGIRSIQIGLSGVAVTRHVQNWIVGAEDLTDLSQKLAASDPHQQAAIATPARDERPFPMDPVVAARLGA